MRKYKVEDWPSAAAATIHMFPRIVGDPTLLRELIIKKNHPWHPHNFLWDEKEDAPARKITITKPFTQEQILLAMEMATKELQEAYDRADRFRQGIQFFVQRQSAKKAPQKRA